MNGTILGLLFPGCSRSRLPDVPVHNVVHGLICDIPRTDGKSARQGLPTVSVSIQPGGILVSVQCIISAKKIHNREASLLYEVIGIV
jgi:hypothetical protein